MKDKFNYAISVLIQEINKWREKIDSYEDYEGGIQTICELLHNHPFNCSDEILNEIGIPLDPEKIEQLIFFNMPKNNYKLRVNKKMPDDKWIYSWTLKKGNKYVDIDLYGPYAFINAYTNETWSLYAFDYDTIETCIDGWD